MILVELVYFSALALLSLYGLNSLVLTWLFLRHRNDPVPDPAPPPAWPHVTVQLPIYNERHTVERLLRAMGALDYPRDRLEIQALDDSSDETIDLAAQGVARLRAVGVDAVHLMRDDREGYKAGALSAGMAQAKGDLIAIFDADFLPQPEFLRRVVPHFAEPDVGCVQARWGHLNRDHSLLTRLEALGMDGHFVIEQTARHRSGLLINFNGTAGIWRRSCVEDAGGWTGDTLTEDLDLSYRAQLRGWRFRYLPDLVVPAELPSQMAAFKRQQARWAQGSIQTAIKLVGPLLRSQLSLALKLEGLVHLTGYAVHPLMLISFLLSPPLSFSDSWALRVTPWLMIAAVGPPLLYAVAQASDGGRWRRRLIDLPLLVLLGTGIALSNTLAAARAAWGISGEFRRTPKHGLRGEGGAWKASGYALGLDKVTWGELGLLLYAVSALAAQASGRLAMWMLMHACGLALVAGLSLYQGFQRRRWRATQPRSGAGTVARTRRFEPQPDREG